MLVGVNRPLSAVRRDGSELAAEIGLSRIEWRGETLVLAAVRDRSEQVVVERELNEARTMLARADERARVARDLHDTVSQDLYGLGLTIQRAQRRGVEDTDLESFLAQLDGALRRLTSVIFELREISGSGRLLDQLHGVIDMSARALGFAPELRVQGDLRALPASTAPQLIFVLRELLSNCAKHSGAERVLVDLAIVDSASMDLAEPMGAVPEALAGAGTVGLGRIGKSLGFGAANPEAGEPGRPGTGQPMGDVGPGPSSWVRLTVVDDGVGFDAAAIGQESAGYGLVGVRSRALALGGAASWAFLDDGARTGTRAVWAVPIPG
jgi:signal transduction histidine kinase